MRLMGGVVLILFGICSFLAPQKASAQRTAIDLQGISLDSLLNSDDRNYTYIGVRGFGRPTDYNDRILLLIDGHTANENVYGAAYFGTELPLDMDSVERIGVVRGPGSALYGTGAMFGVVNVITKAGDALEGVKVSGEAGSFRHVRGDASAGKRLKRGGEVLVSGVWGNVRGQDLYFKEYDAPSTHRGVAEHLDWDRYYGLRARWAQGGLALSGLVTSREKGIPTGAFGVVFNDPSSRTLDAREFVEARYEGRVSADKHILWRGFFDHYDYRGRYPYQVLSFDASDGRWLGGELQFRWDPFPSSRLTVGAEHNRHFRADYRR